MSSRRILIVEDQRAAAEEIAARLAALGYTVAGIVASAAEARTIEPEQEAALVNLRLSDGFSEGSPPRNHPSVLYGAGEAAALPVPFSDLELRASLELALCRHDATRAVHEFEGFFSLAQDLFCFLDFAGHFRRLNPAWEATLGFTREELMARPFIEFVHPDDRERTLNQNQAVRGGGQARGFENRYRCKDGSYRWLLWNSAPSTADRVIYAVARDVTARKQAEEERARLVAELQASLAEVQTLREILPICSYCRKIRDDEDYWDSVESYVARHTRTRFSHGICPDCMENRVEPELSEFEAKRRRPENE